MEVLEKLRLENRVKKISIAPERSSLLTVLQDVGDAAR